MTIRLSPTLALLVALPVVGCHSYAGIYTGTWHSTLSNSDAKLIVNGDKTFELDGKAVVKGDWQVGAADSLMLTAKTVDGKSLSELTADDTSKLPFSFSGPVLGGLNESEDTLTIHPAAGPGGGGASSPLVMKKSG